MASAPEIEVNLDLMLLKTLERMLERGIEVRPLYPGMRNSSILEGCVISLAGDKPETSTNDPHRTESFGQEVVAEIRRSW